MSDRQRKQWRVIPGFSRYEITPDGEMRIVKTRKRRRAHDTGERIQVWLTADGGASTTRNLGHLILLAHVGPPGEGQECSHLNGDYVDNVLENLAWESHAENIARKRDHGTTLSGDRHGKTKLTDAQAAEIRRRRLEGERGIDLAAEFGVSPQCISDIKKGRRVVTRSH